MILQQQLLGAKMALNRQDNGLELLLMGQSQCGKLTMLKTVPQLKTAMGGRLYGVFFLPSCGTGTAPGLPGAVPVSRGQKLQRRFTT